MVDWPTVGLLGGQIPFYALDPLTSVAGGEQVPLNQSGVEKRSPFSPLTGRPTMAFVGDSIQAASVNSNTATGTFNLNRGPSFWARFLSGQRIYSPQSQNFGVSGDTTASVLARMGPILTSGAGIYYVAIGTNNVGAISYQDTISQLDSIWDQCRATGAVVVASTILPRTLAQATSVNFLERVNNWIRSQAFSRDNFYVVDPVVAYGNPTATDWSPRTNYSYDGLHPKALGAYYSSNPLATFINQQLPPAGVPLASIADVYDATNNPNGNLCVNGILAYTSGGTNGGGGAIFAGTFADGWTYAAAANGGTVSSLTVTGTSQSNFAADGRPAQRIQLSGTYTGVGSAAVDSGTAVIFRQDLGFTNWQAGDVARLSMGISVASGATNISGIEAQLAMTVAGTTYTIGDGSCITGDLFPSEAFSGVLQTPEFVIPAGTISLMRPSLRIWMLTGSGLTAALDISVTGIKLQKV